MIISNLFNLLIKENAMKNLNVCGIDIKIGSNQKENHLLYDEADKDDIWFHVDGMPSAHMWISNGELTKAQLYQIAIQLKKSSKYKKMNNIPIVYTQKANLIKGEKPGSILIIGKSKIINV